MKSLKVHVKEIKYWCSMERAGSIQCSLPSSFLLAVVLQNTLLFMYCITLMLGQTSPTHSLHEVLYFQDEKDEGKINAIK